MSTAENPLPPAAAPAESGIETAGTAAAEAPQPSSTASVLAGIGLFGYERVEPAILASLLTGDPLLLIGPHGTGKSMLLERLARALGLDFRHYNASLICFDDLIGFPVPNKTATSLKYLQTPATIWKAEAVFFDEVSRCKPDVQNKLFSIIHERRVQGMDLERLRYRWSAMNPPSMTEDSENYRGSEPLDKALADRYAFIVEVPDWFAMDQQAQARILEKTEKDLSGHGIAGLRNLLEEARKLWPSVSAQMEPFLSDYVRYLAVLLREAEIRLSARRLVMLMRNIPAVHAVRMVSAGETANVSDSAYLALICSIPQRAEGIPVPESKVLAAHTEAWKSASGRDTAELIRIYSEKAPLKRAILAAKSRRLTRQQRSVIIADCLQFLPNGTRHALATYLMTHDLAGKLVAAVAEQISEDYALVALRESGHRLDRNYEVRTGDLIAREVTKLQSSEPESAGLANLLFNLFLKEKLNTESEVRSTIRAWWSSWEQLRADQG